MTTSNSPSIDALNTEFTITYTATDSESIPATEVRLYVMYYGSKNAYVTDEPDYIEEIINDVTPSTTISTEFTWSYENTKDEVIPDGLYSFKVECFNSSGAIADTANTVKWYGDYHVRLKIVKDTQDLGDQMESNNIVVKDYFRNEWLHSILKSSSYAASSALVSKALNGLDFLQKLTKYF